MDFVNKMTEQAKDAAEEETTKHLQQAQEQMQSTINQAMGSMGIKTDEDEDEPADGARGQKHGGRGGGGHGGGGGRGGGGGGGRGQKHGGGGQKHGGRGHHGGGGHKAGNRGGHVGDDFDDEVAVSIKADVRMFSGCEDAQTSADVHDVAKFGLPDACGAGGACTNAVLVNVKDQKPDSWMSLLKGMRATLKAKKFKQIPQLATSKKLDIHSPFSLSGGEGGKHRALLIGINYKGCGAGELKGCHNDVDAMKAYIPEHGYPAEEGPNLKILMDDGNHEDPNKDNIVKAMKWLVHGAQPGDSLFMHYSGHGGSVKDTTGDEEDCKDETMVPVDYRKSGQLKDDDILSMLVMPLPEGVTLSVVMDCCHSGSILDLPYSFDADDGSLELVDAGGSGVVKPKVTFAKKMQKKKRAKK